MTHYEILGVSRYATQAEIKAAYKTLIKRYHPDIYHGNKDFAEQKTKEINLAYNVLSNEEKKSSYDSELDSLTTYKTTPTYDYTPPKYETSYTDYYNKYKSKENNTYEDYTKRYSDYHRSKTPNSNYTNYSHETISPFIYDKIKYIVIILIIYFFILIFMYLQASSLIKDQATKNEVQVPTTQNITTEENSTKERSIYDYFTEAELREMYEKNFSDTCSYPEFKKIFTEYFFTYYTFND